ncbi:MAG: glycosyltransferase [Gemmatimonadota bacterium]|nr:MAG: glycosyltransferase [Gemmatimonadota bacterium]
MTTLTITVGAIYALMTVTLLANIWQLRRSRPREHPHARQPSLSVLIPARNEAGNLRRLLPSLLSQEYADFEVIVYDDGSEDATWEVLQGMPNPRLKTLRGSGPPAGWVGKVHALYRASLSASGEALLFLDADAALKDARALARLVSRFDSLPRGSVLTGITHLRGGGRLLVSLVPFILLSQLPIALVPRTPFARLSGLNGQCWMIRRSDYERLSPHRANRDEVLEDIRIGQYLKRHGVIPYMADLQNEVEVWMYRSVPEAWVGFRKNVYPFMGETPWSFLGQHALYLALFVAAPLLSPWFIACWYGLKTVSDRFVRCPISVTLATPLSLGLGALLQLDSAISHWTGRVRWKGRSVVRGALR